MATAVQMPALSPTMTEGKITRWIKKEGDKVSSGDAIAECETDKSNLEIEAYEDGYLLKVMVKEGESAPVGSPIAFLGEKGEKVDAGAAAPAPAAKPPEAPKAAPPPAPAQAQAAAPPKPALAPQPAAQPAGQVVQLRRAEPSEGDGRLRASPLAKKMASENSLDLAALQGSGPQGRIIKRDIEQAMAQGSAARQV
ncbi:MAG TPA: biotin/lipoyl-containing protein, partial [Myxococcaceae bacterium]|nr:biotin/lipoyl-containing protein [Myxococcaceae bacterium]